MLPIDATLEEKAKFTIKYLSQGLEALETSEEEKKSDYVENFSKPEKVIPLNFIDKAANTNVLNKVNLVKKLDYNKALILQKLISSYYCLAVISSRKQNYGQTFQYLNIALDSYFARCKLWRFDENIALKKILYYLMTFCGDCRLLIANKINQFRTSQNCSENSFQYYLKQYNSAIDFYDQLVIKKTNQILNNSVDNDYLKIKNYFDINNINGNFEQNYFIALNTYTHAMDLLQNNDKNEVILMKKRLANLKNELGTYYLTASSKLMIFEEDNLNLVKNIENLLQKSYDYFNEGVVCFEEISDFSNCALLTANCAKLMRIYSKFYSEEFYNKLKLNADDIIVDINTNNSTVKLFSDLSTNYSKIKDKSELILKEKACLLKAIDFYTKAIKYISNNKSQCELVFISNSIYWDLSSTCFNLACLMQDEVPVSLVEVSRDNIEKEITDYMNRSINYLKNISFENTAINNELSLKNIEYRLATIHHRLASLYHHSFRNQSNETKKKHMKSLAELHYGKAFNYYKINEHVCEKLRILLEEVALSEFHFESISSVNAKLKCLENCLKLFYKCKECLNEIIILEKNYQEDSHQDYKNEVNKLTKIFIQRIQFTLKNLIKLLTSKKKNVEEQKFYDDIKSMYMKSLNEFDFKKFEINVSEEDTSLNFNVEFYKGIIDYLDKLNKIAPYS